MGTLSDCLRPEAIRVFGAVSKEEALKELAAAACVGSALDVSRVQQAILEREALLSTGIGLGVALPHARLPEVERFSISVGVCREGIDYGSLDRQPVRLVVLIIGPSGSHSEFVRFIAKVTGVLKQEAFRRAILQAETLEEVAAVMDAF